MRILTAVVLLTVGFVCDLQAEELSIYDIQYTTDPNGLSPEDGNEVDCYGGIVIHKWSRGRERLILYDSNHPDGWGGILVKGPFDSTVFEDVNVGDWIRLDDVIVYEELNKARGNTTLFYEEYSSYTPLSTGNELPVPLVVDINEIAVNYDPIEQTCYVTDHRAEKYEAMYIQVRMVSIGDVGVGSHVDNYSLNTIDDPNIYCWASDYINIDNPDTYTPHPIVESGLQLCRVNGILEQYTQLSDGWDYYQLLTTEEEDFQTEQIADFDYDCDVDFIDFSDFAFMWFNSGCAEPDWCSGADLTQNGSVDMLDLEKLSGNWLEGKLY